MKKDNKQWYHYQIQIYLLVSCIHILMTQILAYKIHLSNLKDWKMLQIEVVQGMLHLKKRDVGHKRRSWNKGWLKNRRKKLQMQKGLNRLREKSENVWQHYNMKL